MKSKVVAKIKHLAVRYLPLEIVGTVTSLLAAFIVYSVTRSLVAAAFAGSVGEAVGFYATAGVREVFHYYRAHKQQAGWRRLWLTGYNAVRGILLEFGPAEAIDGVFVRPFLLYILPLLMHNLALGWFIGKLLADIAFLVLADLGYMLRKRFSPKT